MYILSNLADTSNANHIKEVAAPSISWSQIIENDRVGEYGGWKYGIGGGGVFIEGQAGTECADGSETGCGNTAAKVLEAIAHMLILLLSFGVKYNAGGRFDLYKEYRVLVVFDDEQGDDVYRISRS